MGRGRELDNDKAIGHRERGLRGRVERSAIEVLARGGLATPDPKPSDAVAT
jgi:hypothetical protein